MLISEKQVMRLMCDAERCGSLQITLSGMRSTFKRDDPFRRGETRTIGILIYLHVSDTQIQQRLFSNTSLLQSSDKCILAY